jgi:hypothetical protein
VARRATFFQKGCPVPPCRRRIGPVVQADAWFGSNRVTPVIYTTYAIPPPEVDIAPFDDAQGRLRQGGRFYSFSQKCCTECNIFVKKIKSVPCCRRRCCRSPGETPSLMNHRVTPVI